MSEPRREPGETRPGLLERAPSERSRAQAPAPTAEPRHLRSLLAGIAAGAATALIMALLRSVLDLGAGLLVVAAVGGWAIGVSVQWGAWGGRQHERSGRGLPVAGAFAVFTWGAWLLLSWIVAQAILVGSSRPLLERLAATSFLEDFLAPQFGLLEIAALIILVGAAVYGARDR